jgi:hypothetical protein|tara:strand:+ start:228 stop:488 length:261 start_codon:yes stop_codon:yes gene_type:complete
MSRDLIIDMQISVNVSKDYYNKITNMSDEELAEHITKQCFRNNNRFLMNYQIVNGDSHRFEEVDIKQWFNNLKQQNNYYLKEKENA